MFYSYIKYIFDYQFTNGWQLVGNWHLENYKFGERNNSVYTCNTNKAFIVSESTHCPCIIEQIVYFR